jgi:hypothetical protein
MELIKKKMDFVPFIRGLKNDVFGIDNSNILSIIYNDIFILCKAEFSYYIWDKEIENIRNNEELGLEEYECISDFDKMIRDVKNKIFASKNNINLELHKLFNESGDTLNCLYDIVCNVGYVIDRLIVEYIKREHLKEIEEYEKVILSQSITDKLEFYIKNKLESISKIGFYDFIPEIKI